MKASIFFNLISLFRIKDHRIPRVGTIIVILAGLLLVNSGVFAQNYTVQGTNETSLYLNSKAYQVAYSGSYRDFIIPAAANGKYLYLRARGGDGGKIDYEKTYSGLGQGGQGADMIAYFKVGSGPNEIPVGARLRFVAGGQGASYSNHGQLYHHGGGGGGGTGILFLPGNIAWQDSKAADWKLLMVAGGGGGGHAKFGQPPHNGLPGNNGENGTGDQSAPYYGLDRRPGYDYAANFGGGGTLLDPNGRFPYNVDPRGGFQQANNQYQPIGAAGGHETDGNDGGFGFGAGGAGKNKIGGGGGNGGDMSIGVFCAGGGGSFINSGFAIPGTVSKKKNSTTGNPGNGFVQYQFADSKPQSISKGKSFPMGTSLLRTGAFVLSWQGDGNLVLYESGTPRWASGTNGNGNELDFQGDGNLVIYNHGKPTWASGTNANHHDGKGGLYLTLSPTGRLSIVNEDNMVIWSVN